MDFIDVDVMKDNDSDKNDNKDLIPNECFIADINPDKSKKFTCKQCSQHFKSVKSVKQQIGHMHKSLKRTADKTGNSSRKSNKKPTNAADFEEVEQKPDGVTVNSTAAYCQGFLDGEEYEEDTFLDDSIDNLGFGKNAVHSTAISDDDDDELFKPDQDHDTIVKEEDDMNLMKARIISLEIELIKKDTIINEKVNDLNRAVVDNEELNGKIHELKKYKEEKNDALDIATGKIESLEEDNLNLKKNLKMYSATIKKQRIQIEQEEVSKDGTNDKEKELRKNLKEKNKKLSEAEARARKLGEKLGELEGVKADNSNSVNEKYKKVNDKLTEKTKDCKKVENNLKKAESRVNELLETIDMKNKKISEVENSNTRQKLMKEQAVEIKEKSGAKDDIKTNAPKLKCRFENTGVCRQNNCVNIHPKKTCQPFSKLGSCPLESSCEHRHPFGVCFEWEKHGTCRDGDQCRHRHPFDVAMRAATPDHFLGYGSPGGPGGQGQAAQAPSQGHHDMRGNRW